MLLGTRRSEYRTLKAPAAKLGIMLQNNEPTDADQRRTRRRFLLGVLIVGVLVALAAVALYLSAAFSV